MLNTSLRSGSKGGGGGIDLLSSLSPPSEWCFGKLDKVVIIDLEPVELLNTDADVGVDDADDDNIGPPNVVNVFIFLFCFSLSALSRRTFVVDAIAVDAINDEDEEEEEEDVGSGGIFDSFVLSIPRRKLLLDN